MNSILAARTVSKRPAESSADARVGRVQQGNVRRAATLLAGSLLLAIYLAVYLRYFPNANGDLGQDYWLHFPNLLAGYYWYLENGVWAVPWFTPAQCGGFPYFPDPNVAYYSVPQFLVFLMPPLAALRLTFALFAGFGLASAYGLMRSSFGASRSAALLVGGLFLFNGFYTYRMIAGHLTFHAFDLLPALAWALLPAPDSAALSVRAIAARVIAAALILCYMFQTGMVHGIPPAMLSVVILMLVHGLSFGWRPGTWGLAAGAALLALALSSAKLAAELALLANFPRDHYPLPGYDGLLKMVWAVFQSLFGFAPDGADVLVNGVILLRRHEMEYGVSIAPLALILIAARAALAPRPPGQGKAELDGVRLVAYGAIAFLLIAPMAINLYQPAWNAFLKSLPYFANSSSLVRELCAYILPVVVIAGLCLDRIAPPKLRGLSGRPGMAAIALGVMALQNIATPKDYYAAQDYPPEQIEAAYVRARASAAPPPIVAVSNRIYALVAGESQLTCYQPLFGYWLEDFPRAPLRPGPVTSLADGAFNLKNPACYLFANENACRPGDPFQLAQESELEAFTHYRPFAFTFSSAQAWADRLNWVAAIATVGLFALLTLSALARRGKARS